MCGKSSKFTKCTFTLQNNYYKISEFGEIIFNVKKVGFITFSLQNIKY